jgi:hypothetical protein
MRAVALDEAAEQGGDARGELGVALDAIGVAGIVGGIDDRHRRKQPLSRAQDRETADAGVEKEDRSRRIGVGGNHGRQNGGEGPSLSIAGGTGRIWNTCMIDALDYYVSMY